MLYSRLTSAPVVNVILHVWRKSWFPPLLIVDGSIQTHDPKPLCSCGKYPRHSCCCTTTSTYHLNLYKPNLFAPFVKSHSAKWNIYFSKHNRYECVRMGMTLFISKISKRAASKETANRCFHFLFLRSFVGEGFLSSVKQRPNNNEANLSTGSNWMMWNHHEGNHYKSRPLSLSLSIHCPYLFLSFSVNISLSLCLFLSLSLPVCLHLSLNTYSSFTFSLRLKRFLKAFFTLTLYLPQS